MAEDKKINSHGDLQNVNKKQQYQSNETKREEAEKIYNSDPLVVESPDENIKSDTLNEVEEEINTNPEHAQEIFNKAISEGRVNLNIRQGAQNKHIEGTHEYKQERSHGREPSILTANPDELVKKHAGKGTLIINDSGQWTHKENFTDDNDIGIYKNKRYSDSAPTSRGKIHYSNKGTHIVPDNPKGKK